VYSSSDSRKASFQISVAATTDLDHATSTIAGAVTSIDDVVDDPAPTVQAAELINDAVALSISYWYPATMINSSAVTDEVIRSTISALNSAGIELTAQSVTVTQAAGSSSVADANGKAGSDDDEDSSSTS